MRYDCIGWVALCEETFPIASAHGVAPGRSGSHPSRRGLQTAAGSWVLVILQVSTNGIGSISQSNDVDCARTELSVRFLLVVSF